MALVCPKCQNLSSEGAILCDCGYAFVVSSTGTKKCPSCAETILVSNSVQPAITVYHSGPW